jgi:phosphatidylcholine synthase
VNIKREEGLKAAAYGVHVLTATGAALGFLALMAATRGEIRLAFVWLGVALIVDAADGPLARRVSTKTRAARYSGEILDLVVDFLNYVVVPCAIIVQANLMHPLLAVIAGIAVTVASALYFADNSMKTNDWWFRGFPAVWNIVAFHLVVFQPPGLVCFVILIVATIAMFLPIAFVHPIRVERLRSLTIGLMGIWAAAATYAIYAELNPNWFVKALLFLCAVYFCCLGALRGRLTQQDSA